MAFGTRDIQGISGAPMQNQYKAVGAYGGGAPAVASPGRQEEQPMQQIDPALLAILAERIKASRNPTTNITAGGEVLPFGEIKTLGTSSPDMMGGAMAPGSGNNGVSQTVLPGGMESTQSLLGGAMPAAEGSASQITNQEQYMQLLARLGLFGAA